MLARMNSGPTGQTTSSTISLQNYFDHFADAITGKVNFVNARHFANLLIGPMKDVVLAAGKDATIDHVVDICRPYLDQQPLFKALTAAQKSTLSDNLDLLRAVCDALYPPENRSSASIKTLGMCLLSWFDVPQRADAVDLLVNQFADGMPAAPWFEFPGMQSLYAKYITAPKKVIEALSEKRRGSNICSSKVAKEEANIRETVHFVRSITPFQPLINLMLSFRIKWNELVSPLENLATCHAALLDEITSQNLFKYLNVFMAHLLAHPLKVNPKMLSNALKWLPVLDLLKNPELELTQKQILYQFLTRVFDQAYENLDDDERNVFLQALYERFKSTHELYRQMVQKEKAAFFAVEPLLPVFAGFSKAKLMSKPLAEEIDKEAFERECAYDIYSALQDVKTSHSFDLMFLFRYFNAKASQVYYFGWNTPTDSLKVLNIKQSDVTTLKLLSPSKSDALLKGTLKGKVKAMLYGDVTPDKIRAGYPREEQANFVLNLREKFDKVVSHVAAKDGKMNAGPEFMSVSLA
tara:strand:+ start:5065 stop:6633 length:1569 start_codon:yes stop_codon:yes gene_type:complete